MILGMGRKSRVSDHQRLLALKLSSDEERELTQSLLSLPRPDGDIYDLEREPGGPHQAILRQNLRR